MGRYTLPALELRMMLQGMRQANENFTLVYTRIASTPSQHDHAAAEAWRVSGCGRRVTLNEHIHAVERYVSCYVEDTCVHTNLTSPIFAAEVCAKDELALLEPPGWLAPKLLLHNPYPILEPVGRYCGSS